MRQSYVVVHYVFKQISFNIPEEIFNWKVKNIIKSEKFHIPMQLAGKYCMVMVYFVFCNSGTTTKSMSHCIFVAKVHVLYFVPNF